MAMNAKPSTQIMTESTTFEDRLEDLEAEEQPIVFGSFDLRPDGAGSPTAPRILRQALRQTDSDGLDHGRLTELLESALDEAAEAGHAGLFLAGTIDAPTRFLLPSATPPRNSLVIARKAPRFELERLRALCRAPAAVVWADRSGVTWAHVGGHGEPVTGRLDGDLHAMHDSLGRTGQHDRGGSAQMPAGGHSKARIEESAEEARDRFAREAAEALQASLTDADELIVHGPPEFSARLVGQLDARLRDRLEESDPVEREPSIDELAAEARELSVRSQYRQASALLDTIIGGAAGERAASKVEVLTEAAAAGRIDTLVFDEDSVGHFGTAIDARVHEPTRDAAVIESLLRSARRDSAATCWFVGHESMDDQTDGVVGLLRW